MKKIIKFQKYDKIMPEIFEFPREKKELCQEIFKRLFIRNSSSKMSETDNDQQRPFILSIFLDVHPHFIHLNLRIWQWYLIFVPFMIIST
jgi:hypothetical protein